MNKIFYVLVLCISFVNAQNQLYEVKGKVIDFHDGKALQNSKVVLQTKDKTTIVHTDSLGVFLIKGNLKGNSKLTVYHDECEPFFITITIPVKKELIIKMEHHVHELEQVNVRTKEYNNLGIKSELDTQTLENYSSKNLGDALNEVSGISSINTGNSIVKPIIHGLHSSRVMVLNQGVRMENQQWGIEHAPSIDINSVEKVSVIKSSNALEYSGDAIGGIVLLESKKFPKKDSLYGKSMVSGNSNGRGILLNSTLTKTFKKGFFIKGQASFNCHGDYHAPDYNLTNTGYLSKGISFESGFHSFKKGISFFYNYVDNEIGILRASHIGNSRDLYQAISERKPLIIEDFSYDINAPKQKIIHHLAKVNLYKRFAKFGKVDFQYDFQMNNRKEYDVRRTSESSTIPALDLELITQTFSANILYDAITDFNAKFGIMYRNQDNYPNPDTGVRRLIPDYKSNQFGSYFITDYKWNSNWKSEFGIRYDYFSIDAEKFYTKSRWEELNYDVKFSNLITKEYSTQYLTNPKLNFNSIASSLGINYTNFNDFSLTLNYNLSQRIPNPAELFSDGLHHSSASIEYGDLEMKKEISNQISFTVEKKFADFSVSLLPYVNFIKDYMYIEPIGIEKNTRGEFLVWNYKQNNALLLGADLDFNYDASFMSWKGNASYIYAQNTDKNEPLISIPPFTINNQLSFKIKKWKNLNAGITSVFVAKQNRFPNTNFSISIIENEEVVERNIDVSSTEKAYHLLGINANKTINFKKSSLNLSFSVENLFNTKYRNYLNRLRYFSDDLGRNFNIQIKYNY
ncbi:MAG: TonB-dependent receptor [Flavobacteriales bacterium]|nr:TonB-dependent receptor [Flavobacteriales bacterium]